MPTKTFHLQQWTPQVAKVAQSTINDIKSVAPELEVLFMGAAALGLPGKNDIDLDVLCNVEDVPKYTKELTKVLGKPKETTDKLTAWEFIKDGIEIDCILSDPTLSHVPKQKKRFEILKASPKLLEEYKRLKISCDGLPYKEYEKRKLAFFEKIYSSSEKT
jgi:GrpB-like predicted nucleotidyltransferase (UPF0157 family)